MIDPKRFLTSVAYFFIPVVPLSLMLPRLQHTTRDRLRAEVGWLVSTNGRTMQSSTHLSFAMTDTRLHDHDLSNFRNHPLARRNGAHHPRPSDTTTRALGTPPPPPPTSAHHIIASPTRALVYRPANIVGQRVHDPTMGKRKNIRTWRRTETTNQRNGTVDVHTSPSCVYALESETHPTSAPYIGFTIDPILRLRKHNGDVKGGAEETKADRPWRIALCILPRRLQPSTPSAVGRTVPSMLPALSTLSALPSDLLWWTHTTARGLEFRLMKVKALWDRRVRGHAARSRRTAASRPPTRATAVKRRRPLSIGPLPLLTWHGHTNLCHFVNALMWFFHTYAQWTTRTPTFRAAEHGLTIAMMPALKAKWDETMMAAGMSTSAPPIANWNINVVEWSESVWTAPSASPTTG